MAITMFSRYLTICEIFATIINVKSFDLGKKSRASRKTELGHLTENVRIHIGDFF